MELIFPNGRRSSPHALLIWLTLLVFTTANTPLADDIVTPHEDYCALSTHYLEQRTEDAQTSLELDYSCLTHLAALPNPKATYQLIDTRTTNHAAGQIEGAWQMSVNELRFKKGLQGRTLLLIGEGFSRVKAAQDCATLRQHGFDQLKILVGGAEVWHRAERKSRRIIDNSINSVSSRELLYEYFNGKVVLLSTSQQLSSDLNSLGIRDHHILTQESSSKFYDTIVSEGGGGFYPVVIVGSLPERLSASWMNMHNLYHLEGGAEALSSFIDMSAWTNHNRSSTPRRYLCGKG